MNYLECLVQSKGRRGRFQEVVVLLRLVHRGSFDVEGTYLS